MIREGTRVTWKWGNGYAVGKVAERLEESVTRTIEGKSITRDGSRENPALVIEQEDGQMVLKLQSEVEREDES